MKQIRASTLMETLVATVLIVIIFMISSMVLNTVLSGNIGRQTAVVEERLNALEYQYRNKVIQLPYDEEFGSWEISMVRQVKEGIFVVSLEADNKKTKTTIVQYIGYGD